MKLDHVAAAGLLVQAVDILGDDGLKMACGFKACQTTVGRIRRRLGQHLLHPLYQQLPHLAGVAPEGIDVGDLEGIDFFPQAAGATKRRNAAFDRNAGPREGHNPPRGGHFPGGARNQIVHRTSQLGRSLPHSSENGVLRPGR